MARRAEQTAAQNRALAAQARTAARRSCSARRPCCSIDHAARIGPRSQGCWLLRCPRRRRIWMRYNNAAVGRSLPPARSWRKAARQLGELNVHSRYLHSGVMDYAERLLKTLPPQLSNITFTCTGSESNDLALRLAARFTGAGGIIVTETAYHGNTELTVSQVSPSSLQPGSECRSACDGRCLRPTPIACPPQSCRTTLRKACARGGRRSQSFRGIGVKLSALLIERSIFSSDGVFADPPGFLRAAVEIVQRAGGIVIADEVQCGFARTGTSLWGFERHGLQPDIVTMGKPMGNGYPIGAVATRPAILDALLRRNARATSIPSVARQRPRPASDRWPCSMSSYEEEPDGQRAQQRGQNLAAKRLRRLAQRHSSIVRCARCGTFHWCRAGRWASESGIISPGGATPSNRIYQCDARPLRTDRGRRPLRGYVLKMRPPLCFSSGK